MNNTKIVNDFSYDKEVRIGVEVDDYIAAEKDSHNCPGSPSEISIKSYFVNEYDEVICRVPPELAAYLKLEQKALEDFERKQEEGHAADMAERQSAFKEYLFSPDDMARMYRRAI